MMCASSLRAAQLTHLVVVDHWCAIFSALGHFFSTFFGLGNALLHLQTIRLLSSLGRNVDSRHGHLRGHCRLLLFLGSLLFGKDFGIQFSRVPLLLLHGLLRLALRRHTPLVLHLQ